MGSVNDARYLAKVFAKRYPGCIIHSLCDEEATQEHILSTLHEAVSRPIDRIIFFFAGHAIKDFEGMLLASDDCKSARKGITSKQLREIFKKVSSPEDCIVIIDACYAGSFEKSSQGNFTLIASSFSTQPAKEVLKDSWHGAFTYQLGNVLDAVGPDATWEQITAAVAFHLPHQLPQFNGQGSLSLGSPVSSSGESELTPAISQHKLTLHCQFPDGVLSSDLFAFPSIKADRKLVLKFNIVSAVKLARIDLLVKQGGNMDAITVKNLPAGLRQPVDWLSDWEIRKDVTYTFETRAWTLDPDDSKPAEFSKHMLRFV